MLRKSGKILAISTGLLTALAAFSCAADISTHTFTSCSFPDTSQSASYTATFGEDHDYAPSASIMSFTVYNPVAGSSVTVDNRTGLMWVTNPNDAGISGFYTWENAISACETLSYASYADWRLPNVRELVSIADYSRQNPSINTTYFFNTQNNYYWSSTTFVPNTTDAWVVYFINGNMSNSFKTNAYYVRCVRGGP